MDTWTDEPIGSPADDPAPAQEPAQDAHVVDSDPAPDITTDDDQEQPGVERELDENGFEIETGRPPLRQVAEEAYAAEAEDAVHIKTETDERGFPHDVVVSHEEG
jgi:hypothetical protein